MNVLDAGMDAGSLNWTDLYCQYIKLVGKRQLDTVLDHELSVANHVHELDAGFVALTVSQTAGLC